MPKAIAIGIDLGTTYSRVGVFRDGMFEIIADDQGNINTRSRFAIPNEKCAGNRTTPSYVAFTDTERLVGHAAKNQVAVGPANAVFGMLFRKTLAI